VSEYRSLEAELHDVFWALEGEPVELKLLAEVLKTYPGRALEVGCGSGRLLLPLLAEGWEVEGIDFSAEMLELARKKARELGVEAVLHQGDVMKFASAVPYDAILVPAFTLQLLPEPLEALRHLVTLLKPGGVIYLSVYRPLAELAKELPEGAWYPDLCAELPDGSLAELSTRHALDRKQRVIRREHHYRLKAADGAVREHFCEQEVRWFTARQLRGMLEKCGLEPLTGFAEFDPGTPIDEESQILTVLARR
jgi:SAM-dependent methyltransferase